MPNPVLLLRAPAPAPESDRYEAAFLRSPSDFRPVSVPVLETTIVGTLELKKLVGAGPGIADDGGFAGVIVTSGRSAEAWGKAVDELVTEERDTSSWTRDWSQTPFYTVGPATAALLSSLSSGSSPPSRAPLCPRDIRGAQESGTAERLAHFIVDDLPGRHSHRLLYLTGDKNRDTLSKILLDAQDVKINLEEFQAYATTGSTTFGKDLETLLARNTDTSPWWIVFFAPSAAAHVAPFLREHFALPGLDSRPNDSGALRQARLATIGPTTAEFLRGELGLKVAAMPEKPNADALVAAIEEAVPRL